MSIHGDMRERHGRVLAELAETGMVMVRRLSEAMLRTEDVQTQTQLGLAYHRVARAVRQTMALEFRLMQEPRREAATPERPAPPPQAAAPRPPTERTSWNEYESDDSNEALEELDALLDAEDLDLDAVHDAVESCIADIRHDLEVDRGLIGLPAPPPAPADRPAPKPNPGSRRSQLLGGAAPPILAAPRPPLPVWRSSA